MAELQSVNVHSHPSKVEHWRHIAEIVALVVAAIWGLYVFVYQEQVKPARESPEISTTAAVTHETLPSGAELVQISEDSRNVGSETFYVAGVIVNAYGIRFGATPRDWGVPLANGFGVINHSLPETSSTLLYSYVHAFSSFHGTAAAEANDIQPQADTHRIFSFAIRPRSYDVGRVEWIICFTKYPDRTWPVTIVRKRDGAYAFNGFAGADGLVCYSSVHDEFPL